MGFGVHDWDMVPGGHLWELTCKPHSVHPPAAGADPLGRQSGPNQKQQRWRIQKAAPNPEAPFPYKASFRKWWLGLACQTQEQRIFPSSEASTTSSYKGQEAIQQCCLGPRAGILLSQQSRLCFQQHRPGAPAKISGSWHVVWAGPAFWLYPESHVSWSRVCSRRGAGPYLQ